jgi:bifunctional DNase/RNase
MEVQMELSRIIITETSDSQLIVLREKFGERSFPIVIGISEAIAIDRRLKGVPVARPLTHDLMASIIERLAAQLEKVVIYDLREHTFFAKLVLRRNGELIEVDSRPSDAIALGAGTEAPIFVEESVLRDVSV